MHVAIIFLVLIGITDFKITASHECSCLCLHSVVLTGRILNEFFFNMLFFLESMRLASTDACTMCSGNVIG